MKNRILYLIQIIIYFSLLSSGVFLYAQDDDDIEISQKEESAGSFYSQMKFVPDISLILDLSGVYRNLQDDQNEGLLIPGLTHAHSTEAGSHSHEALNAHRGFNLNYGELVFYAAVDPYFELFAVFHASAEGVEIEEAYAETSALPFGLKVKMGKFLSSFGRINSQHAHDWDFVDQPLIYNAFLGDHGILELGTQVSWLAPMDLYLLVGYELLKGENEHSFGNEGYIDKNYYFNIEDSKIPNLQTVFIKSSFDIGDLTVLYGLSGAFGRTRSSHNILLEGGHGLKARTVILGGDLTLKYFIDSYRYISLQGEYIYRNMHGYNYNVEAIETEKKYLKKKQTGSYAQIIAKPFRRFRFGARFGLIHINRVKIGLVNQHKPENLYRISGMADFIPSEFTRIRIQYNYDRTRYKEREIEDFDYSLYANKRNHEIIVQCNFAIGKHGAHSF